MKRFILEWGLILSVGFFLTLSTLWGVSLFADQSLSHFMITTTGDVWHDLHFLVGNGNIYLFNQFENDSTGIVRPVVVDLRTSVAPKDGRMGNFTFPGFDLQYCQFIAFDRVAWSLNLSMLFPVVFSLLGAALFHFKLKRLRGRIEQRAG